jgi:hypothetical protein
MVLIEIPLFQLTFRHDILAHHVNGSVTEKNQRNTQQYYYKTDMHIVQEILLSLHNISVAL